MTTLLHWNGVRMRVAHVAADPDDLVLRAVTLPASWEDEAAIALLQLSTTTGALRLSSEAARWLERIDGLPALCGEAETTNSRLGPALAGALLERQIAPFAGLWQGQVDRRAGFVVNLAAFVHEGDFVGERFVETLRLACTALRRLHAVNGPMLNGELPLFDAPSGATSEQNVLGGPAGTLLLTNLDSCLALMGLDYDSERGRDAACYLSWLATSLARQGAGPVPLPPVSCPIAGLEITGRQIRDEMEDSLPDLPNRVLIETGFSLPGPVDALLGVESCGLAPIFSPLRADGHLRASALSRLAHRGLSLNRLWLLPCSVTIRFLSPDRKHISRCTAR